MVDALYRGAKGTDKRTYLISDYCSKNKKVYFSTVLQKHGIRLYLTAASKDRYAKFTVKAIVNPRLVLDPDSGYLGIMPPDSDSLERFQDEFAVLMWKYGLPGYLDEWALVRDDLCVNLQYNKKKAAREQSRMIHKDLLPPQMERVHFFDPKSSPEEQKEQKEKDRHILKLENGMKKKFSVAPRTVAQRLGQLQNLGINPVPLRKDSYLEQQPSLPDILELLEDDTTNIKLQSDGSVSD